VYSFIQEQEQDLSGKRLTNLSLAVQAG